MGEVTGHEEENTMEKLDLELKKAKNRKSPGTNNLNEDLLKYEGASLKKQRSLLFNNL
jgi:hypothetical protein